MARSNGREVELLTGITGLETMKTNKLKTGTNLLRYLERISI